MDNNLKTVDAETLQSTPMAQILYILEGLIPQGVIILSGASKAGKSWLVLWLALMVA